MAFDIEYDEKKNLVNIVNRNLPFAMVNDFDFNSAGITQDIRHKGEVRLIAVGKIEDKIYTLVFTMRGNKLRVISLRNSNRKEKAKWLSNQIPI